MNPQNLSNLVSWSLQVATIATAALMALKVLRFNVPAVRYLFLRLVLAICLLLPFVQPRVIATGHDSRSVKSAASAPAASQFMVAEQARAVADMAVSSNGWGGVVAGLVLIGIFARLGWLAVGVIRLRSLRRIGELAPQTSEFEELQSIIRTSATVRYVSGLEQPVTFGCHKPIVLLPESLRGQSAEIQRAVLAHELWHVRRRDWIWTVVEEAVRAVFWFHPGIWLLLSNIQVAREEVVDELTILATGSRRNYVDALLVYADRRPLFAAAAFARRRHLVHRVILISKEAVMSARRIVVCGALLIAVVVSASWYSIQAFPLAQSVASPAASGGPGPLEQRAKPITPENPVPRRTYHVPPDYPLAAEKIGARANITVQITLDESGQVAETRMVGFSINVGDRGMSTMNPAGVNVEAAINSQPSLSPEQSMRPVLQATIDAALRAVRQWQYAAPADGPVTFPVRVPIGPQTGVAMSPPPPPPPPPPPGTGAWEGTDGAVRVGGGIKVPIKVRNVSPTYPPDALDAGVQGVVILEVRVEPDGRVGQARVLRSIPMLDDAALEAVRQWEFTPTLLNGQAVPVLMTTTINFTLQ